MTTTIFVCDTCSWSAGVKHDAEGRTAGEVMCGLVEAEAESRAGVTVRRQSCLMGCEHPCNTAIAADGKLTYVLGGFTPGPEAAAAVVDYAALHSASDSGQVPYKQWPQGVKGHFIARVPTL